MVGILLHSCTQRRNSNEFQPVCRLSHAVLSEMKARVRMSCAGLVRIVDGRESAEADARSDQLQMRDPSWILTTNQRRPVRTIIWLRTINHRRSVCSGWISEAQITSESRKSWRYRVGLTPQTSQKTCAKCC